MPPVPPLVMSSPQGLGSLGTPPGSPGWRRWKETPWIRWLFMGFDGDFIGFQHNFMDFYGIICHTYIKNIKVLEFCYL